MVSSQYIAGFFDGEGCIRLRHRINKGIRVEAYLANTNLEVLEAIQARCGGRIRILQNKHRIIYRLYWSGFDSVAAFLKPLAKHLIIKRKHAEIVIAFAKRHTSGTRARITEQDLEAVACISSLNSILRYKV